MHYEINISLKGKHFFATHKRSITNTNQLKEIYNILKLKFPENEGYKITITQVDICGKFIDESTL